MHAIKSLVCTVRKQVFFFALTVGIAGFSQAQTASNIPIVSIHATDSMATWSGDPGTFTISRTGNTNPALSVFYKIGGTASNGVDYAMIGTTASLLAGIISTSVVINPINKGQTDIKTVTLELEPSPMANPLTDYGIGSPRSATVYITPDGVTNLPPVVSIVEPTNGAAYDEPANVRLIAFASDPDGTVASVEFFAGSQSLGVVSNGVVVDPGPQGPPPPGTRAYFLVWSNVLAGDFLLTAKATDNGGATAVSKLVHVIVRPKTPPDFIVRITSPPNGAVFRAPLDLPIFAYAHPTSGPPVSVEFFENTSSLGLGHAVASSAIGYSNLFTLVWSNPPAGSFALTAKATDTNGNTETSAAVNISILASGPPPTNRPPIITIVATDPIAIEGTNCWPWLGLASGPLTWTNWASATNHLRFFTNCGPKDAVFTVRRLGATNDAVTVDYAIGGTASNVVDYVALPGSVTIPAGQRAALITVTPIDDGPPDITGTVILRVKPSPTTNYVVGFPGAAGAIILDAPGPRTTGPLSAMLPGNTFHLSANGPDGAWFRIEYSSDLGNWTSVCTNQIVNGSIDFIDPDAQNQSSRFYRAVPELAPAP